MNHSKTSKSGSNENDIVVGLCINSIWLRHLGLATSLNDTFTEFQEFLRYNSEQLNNRIPQASDINVDAGLENSSRNKSGALKP